jgi:hypothetical protein
MPRGAAQPGALTAQLGSFHLGAIGVAPAAPRASARTPSRATDVPAPAPAPAPPATTAPASVTDPATPQSRIQRDASPSGSIAPAAADPPADPQTATTPPDKPSSTGPPQ